LCDSKRRPHAVHPYSQTQIRIIWHADWQLSCSCHRLYPGCYSRKWKCTHDSITPRLLLCCFKTDCRHADVSHGFEVLNLNKSQLNSLDFVTNRFLMKLFHTTNMQIIEFLLWAIQVHSPSCQIAKRRDKFIKSDSQSTNLLNM